MLPYCRPLGHYAVQPLSGTLMSELPIIRQSWHSSDAIPLARAMKIKLVWIEQDRRGRELKRREEILEAESSKPVTARSALRLIARHHPQIAPTWRGLFQNSGATKYRWTVYFKQLDPNRWLYVYADPIDEVDVGVQQHE